MSGPSVVVRGVGREQWPLVVVDGFAADPDALREVASATPFEAASRHYPGISAPLPGSYIPSISPLMATILDEVFGLRKSARLLDASFSIVTTPPPELTLEQRVPHVDAVDAGRIAIVHYLSPEGGDGTAFYRHRATGFETIDTLRAPEYYPFLDAELRAAPPPPAYLNGDSALFERTMLADAAYNRALIYDSRMLHSGAISPDANLDADPMQGRLTVTAFLSAT